MNLMKVETSLHSQQIRVDWTRRQSKLCTLAGSSRETEPKQKSQGSLLRTLSYDREEKLKEIIAKSKLLKVEKQKEKQENEDLVNQLEEQFGGIQSLISKMRRVKGSEPEVPRDDFDQTVRSLGFELRAQPTDRLKTPEEIAADEKKKLEALERDRQRRMVGAVDLHEG